MRKRTLLTTSIAIVVLVTGVIIGQLALPSGHSGREAQAAVPGLSNPGRGRVITLAENVMIQREAPGNVYVSEPFYIGKYRNISFMTSNSFEEIEGYSFESVVFTAEFSPTSTFQDVVSHLQLPTQPPWKGANAKDSTIQVPGPYTRVIVVNNHEIPGLPEQQPVRVSVKAYLTK